MGEAKRRRDSGSADHGPIDPLYRAQMNALAHGLDQMLNGPNCPADKKRVGFFLTLFEFNNDQGRFNYISNADKVDVRVMLKDVLARIEARMSPEGQA